MPVLHRTLFARALGAALAVFAAGANAETSPWYVGASETYSHESNLFRLPQGQQQSDNILTTSLLAGFDQPFGRQHAYANAALRDQRLSDHSDLNNDGYSFTGGLDWSSVERLSGKVRIDLNRSLAAFRPDETLPRTERNIETSQQESASVRWGLRTALALEGTLTHRSLDYSNPAFDVREVRQDIGSLGLSYRFGGVLTVGIDGRATRGTYPRFQPLSTGGFGSDEFRRNDVDLTANWDPTGASNVVGRLSYGHQHHSIATYREFSGVTGSLAWNWRPTGRLQVSTLYLHDTGLENYFYGLLVGGIALASDYSRVTDSARVVANYELTGKIIANANVGYAHRSLSNTPSILFAPTSGHDHTATASLGLRYQPTRTIELGCSVAHESRGTDQPALSSDYTANTTSCYGQLTLQP